MVVSAPDCANRKNKVFLQEMCSKSVEKKIVSLDPVFPQVTRVTSLISVLSPLI